MHEIYNQFTSNMFGKGTDCIPNGRDAPAGDYVYSSAVDYAGGKGLLEVTLLN